MIYSICGFTYMAMYCGVMNNYIPKPRFWINRPHEGPEEFEFDLMGVTFSDGVTRLICKSDIVPSDYMPRVVYNLNEMTGSYHEVGSYKIEGGGGGGGEEGEGGKYIFMSVD